MGFGATVDAVIGGFARFLHVRSANTNTTAEFQKYLDLSLEAMFPPPANAPSVVRSVDIFKWPYRTETLSWQSEHVPLSDEYKQRHRRAYPENLTAYARWMRPAGKRRRSILIHVHGWLEPGSWVEELTLLPLWCRKLEVDTAHIQLPFHGRRSPPKQLFHGEWFWTADLVRSLEGVRQAVLDVRSLMMWFRTQGYEEVGISGLSLGGCIAMLTACLEPLPDYIVPMISHLELGDAIEEAPILWRMKSDLERFGLSASQRRDLFGRVQLATAKPILSNDRQLWVAAREDGYLKASLVRKQWERWGSPPILWIPGGHMTFPIGIKAVTDRMRALPRCAGS